MRDYRKLKAFELVDALAVAVYRATEVFPQQEQFGLTSQVRRAAVSAASNIVEGCARHSERDYLRFLDMAYGSCQELGYQVSLAYRLEYLNAAKHGSLAAACEESSKVLGGLIRALRR